MQYANPRGYGGSISRYSTLRQIIDIDTNARVETFNQVGVEKSNQDVYHTVLTEEENRLDLIAYRYYHDGSMGWAIALANEIVDPFVIKIGTVLRIPPIQSLYVRGGVLYNHV